MVLNARHAALFLASAIDLHILTLRWPFHFGIARRQYFVWHVVWEVLAAMIYLSNVTMSYSWRCRRHLFENMRIWREIVMREAIHAEPYEMREMIFINASWHFTLQRARLATLWPFPSSFATMRRSPG